MKKATVRIKGLVSLMNDVRERLSAGIPPEQADDFRAEVTDGIRSVDEICRRHHATSNDLPAPSRRAYAYLKGIDLKHLPPPTASAPAAAKTIRVTNVVAACNYYHAEFARLATQSDAPIWTADHPEVRRLVAAVRGHAEGIAGVCGEEGGTPADLPTPSRRGYQWLAFLGDPDNLALHLTTLTEVYPIAKTGAAQQMLSLAQRQLPLSIEFYAISHLYRSCIEADGITITVNEGFIGAPHPVLKALIYTALHHPEKQQVSQIKTYSTSDAFEEIVLALEWTTADLSINTKGQHYDLAAIFDRVNVTYFVGALPAPRLTWNKTLTHRKLGHYQFNTDTVMLSLSLDDVAIPPYVVEFVMYHELLHKHLGVKLVNGRRYAHTTAFRDAERRFAQYEQAQAFLSKLGAPHR
ncbi:MAG TPA: hypothetical protein PLH19_15745 [Anaerolineae bacterium]|nr:hypothetical protein [Anaerolineae bacterium]HQH39966.1 hypothetical protein [Anaerolineae bacterium]